MRVARRRAAGLDGDAQDHEFLALDAAARAREHRLGREARRGAARRGAGRGRAQSLADGRAAPRSRDPRAPGPPVQIPGRHEVMFTAPGRLAEAIVAAGRD
jgi:hypothetical protein